jgi:hypothetical protein
MALARQNLNKRKEKGEPLSEVPDTWDAWLPYFYPNYVVAPFGQRHRELWQWFDGLKRGARPRPFVGIWPRGGAKSTTCELGVVRTGARKARKYVWYISETQDQADKHVSSISNLLENPKLERHYPDLAARALSKYGTSKGWRRERLRTRSGLTVDSLGLDVASRGSKIDESRPDLIILDDIDDKYDSAVVTLKKIGIITSSILAAGSSDLAVIFAQNVIHPDSIAARLLDGRADFLSDRIISGPFKAVDDLEYTQVDGKTTITGGKPTWEGQGLEICQNMINTIGLTSFLQESQHEVDNIGGKWASMQWRRREWADLPHFLKVVVWVDPAVTSTDQSDCQGICAGALGVDLKKYMLYAWEGIKSPENAMEQAIEKGLELGADHVGVETDQGGDTWESVYKQACDTIRRKRGGVRIQFPRFVHSKASYIDELTGHAFGSKVARNEKMHASYERGEVIHAEGTNTVLEKALLRFPTKPMDLADAAFWVWHDLETTEVSDQELQEYGAGDVQSGIDDDIIAMRADTLGISFEDAKKLIEKENKKR